MHELLEIILDDLYDMGKKGEIDTDTLQKIFDIIEAREYEYSAMQEGRQSQLPDWIHRVNERIENE